MEIMEIKTITIICIAFHGIYTVDGAIDAPDGVIYDSSKPGDFKFGLAIPGEHCMTDSEQKKEWGQLENMHSEKEKEEALMKLVKKMCGRFRGFQCVDATKRCDCMGSQYTWEPNHDGSYGCRILAKQPCGVVNPETGEMHSCVHGASCGVGAPPPPAGSTAAPPPPASSVMADAPAAESEPEKGNEPPTSNDSRQSGNTCVCQYPGFRNCTEIKMISYSFNENGVSNLRIHTILMASFMFSCLVLIS